MLNSDEVGVLRLACRLATIGRHGRGVLPRAQSVLVAHLIDALANLFEYKRHIEHGNRSPQLVEWAANCRQLFAQLPRRCVQRARSPPLDVSVDAVAWQMAQLKELTRQVGLAMAISVSHDTNGCNRGSACAFCV